MGAELEPLLAVDEIQGNVLSGLNKDFQNAIFFVAPPLSGPGDPAKPALRALMAFLADQTTYMREVEAFKVPFRAATAAGTQPPKAARAWVATAFSFALLRRLRDDADQFSELAFRHGLDATTSALLHDPIDPTMRGSFARWRVGGAQGHPDGVVIVAGDDVALVVAKTQAIRGELENAGCTIQYIDEGRDPSTFSTPDQSWPSGIEHFGFKDGIAQPAVRGRVPAEPDDPSGATERFLAARSLAEPNDIGEIAYAQHGKPLVCPGAFVFGYPPQNGALPGVPAPPSKLGPNGVAPEWAVNGSLLIFRRLSQDVPLFNRFLAVEAARLNAQGVPGFSEEALGARLVGRWRSGAPTMRAPESDDERLGGTASSNDAFLFVSDLAPGDGFPNAPADLSGTQCPFVAHIRKINPRDETTTDGTPADTLTRRLLRRGIPYGPPIPIGATDPDQGERGLLFFAYATSIARQFEFLINAWVNDTSKPSGTQTGFDMIIGQGVPADARRRTAIARGTQADLEVTTDAVTPVDWVFATGGGYFFAPSRSAMTLLSQP